MEEISTDIAKDTFIYRWPKWLRWILLLPTALIGCALASFLYLLLTKLSGLFYEINAKDFYYQLISSIILGATFVYFGTWMAPAYQFAVSIFLIILLTAITTILFLFSFSSTSSIGPLEFSVHALAMLIAGGVVVYNLRNKNS